MGQAWCKEKTTKAQDSKSPLDRVFVRCAHRIYPSLKEEGSVLGGATQRVTSSEIGYAGSPPREVLTRGRSIDSVDRPFHPSDWVDVNLEVPSTPRPSSVLTNLTVDTSLYPATTPTSSCSNLKDVTPIPPPRRRKRNKGRPLPPKPDEIGSENPSSGLKRAETGDEPLYSSVRSPKTSGDEQEPEDEAKRRSQEELDRDGRRTKEVYEHKVNGTGRVISSDVVSGRRAFESSQHQRRPQESEEYERFARTRTNKDSSTPNREEKRIQIKDYLTVPERASGNARTKNYSTVSLPNYDELDTARHREGGSDQDRKQEKTKGRRPVRSSTGSLPAESFLSPFSEKTTVRLEDYIPRTDDLSAYQVLEKLGGGANGVVRDEYVKYDSTKSEDWELVDIGSCELNRRHQVSLEDTSVSDEEARVREDGKDVVDFSTGQEGGRRSPSTDRDVSGSPIYLGKPEAFGKTPSPVLGRPEDTQVDPNRFHLRYYDPPTFADNCRTSPACESPVPKEPFFLDEAKHRSALDTIAGSAVGKPDSDRSERSRMMFARSLSNESEPSEDTYEAKELQSRTGNLIRTISEESLPREMMEERELDGYFDEKRVKDVHNKLKQSLDDWKTITPPPSPEPRIKPEIQDSDHSTLLKVLKDEAAEGSNLSSMTPSLTELEAALSDMLEKEDSQETSKEESKSSESHGSVLKKIEFEVQDYSEGFAGKNAGGRTGEQNLVGHEAKGRIEGPTSLKQILGDKKPAVGRKVSFCSWEESIADTRGEFTELPVDLETGGFFHEDREHGTRGTACPTDVPPEKPSRLNRSLDEIAENMDDVPTPPRRRHRNVGVARKESDVAQNGSAPSEPVSNDRLI